MTPKSTEHLQLHHISRDIIKNRVKFYTLAPPATSQLSELINETAKFHKFIFTCVIALAWALETAGLLFSIIQTDIIILILFFFSK